MYLIHLNVNSPLQKIEEVRHLAQLTNASAVDISKTKFVEFVLNREIVI